MCENSKFKMFGFLHLGIAKKLMIENTLSMNPIPRVSCCSTFDLRSENNTDKRRAEKM